MAQMTVRMSMPMIDGGVLALNKETDLELAEGAFPANIELMEGMLISDPENEVLRAYMAQAYYGYAFGFIEDRNKQRASKFYYRGYTHGKTILNIYGISNEVFEGSLENLQTKINDIDEEHIAILFWTASNLAKWVDLNKDNATSIAQLPKAVMLMQRVLDLDEHFFMSGPNIFFGVYYGGRSPMLGGNFKLSEEYFGKARVFNKNKLLIIDLLEAQYLERQRLNQQSFHNKLQRITSASEDLYPEQALMNMIAKQKASLLLKMEGKWF
jgi:hypothetical protein